MFRLEISRVLRKLRLRPPERSAEFPSASPAELREKRLGALFAKYPEFTVRRMS